MQNKTLITESDVPVSLASPHLKFDSQESLRDASPKTFKQQLEHTFKQLYDFSTKKLNKLGLKLCKDLQIDPLFIMPKDLESFQADLQDSHIAAMHHKHHNIRRNRTLQRIQMRLNNE